MSTKYDPGCWLARHGVWEREGELPPCEGRLVKAHLIRRQVIERELDPAVVKASVWDDAVFVWACGGLTGSSGHHGALDKARTIRIPRSRIPRRTEALAQRLGLGWWLDREYGVRE